MSLSDPFDQFRIIQGLQMSFFPQTIIWSSFFWKHGILKRP